MEAGGGEFKVKVDGEYQRKEMKKCNSQEE
jgi:hypothetical protein